jgi:sphinganine-1-phosphate aldolase
MDDIREFITHHVINDLKWLQTSSIPQIALTALVTFFLKEFYDSYKTIDTDLLSHFKSKFFHYAKKIPQIRNKIKDELSKTQVSLVEDIRKSNKGMDYVRSLPDDGLKQDDVMDKINNYLKMNDSKWREGACSGCVYDADDNISEMATEIYRKYNQSNAMHSDVFPDVRKMEAEVVRMVCDMFHGDEESCGTVFLFLYFV